MVIYAASRVLEAFNRRDDRRALHGPENDGPPIAVGSWLTPANVVAITPRPPPAIADGKNRIYNLRTGPRRKSG